MTTIQRKITRIYVEQGIDLLDIKAVKRYALENKFYDVIVYINNNIQDYLFFAKETCHKQRPFNQ